MIDRTRIGNLKLTVGLRFGEDQYLARIDPDGIHVERGQAEKADIIFAGQPTALAAFVYGGVPLEALAEDDVLALPGDPTLAARFADLFVLPPTFHPPYPGDRTPTVESHPPKHGREGGEES